MDASLRSTPALTAKINKHRDDLIKHYEALINLVGTQNPSRNTSAILQYQIQVETATLIRASEELQLLIRQMQELWLFGQLDTLGSSEVQARTNENAKLVGELLGKVLDVKGDQNQQSQPNGNGEVAMEDGDGGRGDDEDRGEGEADGNS